MFADLRAKLRGLIAATPQAARAAAPRIEAKLRADATTRRGNVPQYPPLGALVPITCRAEGSNLVVRAAAWVMRKAVDKGQVEQWGAIVREEGRNALQKGP